MQRDRVAVVEGTRREEIGRDAVSLLSERRAHHRMAGAQNPCGDGRAAERIALAVTRWLRGERPLPRPSEEHPHDVPSAVAGASLEVPA